MQNEIDYNGMNELISESDMNPHSKLSSSASGEYHGNVIINETFEENTVGTEPAGWLANSNALVQDSGVFPSKYLAMISGIMSSSYATQFYPIGTYNGKVAFKITQSDVTASNFEIINSYLNPIIKLNFFSNGDNFTVKMGAEILGTYSLGEILDVEVTFIMGLFNVSINQNYLVLNAEYDYFDEIARVKFSTPEYAGYTYVDNVVIWENSKNFIHNFDSESSGEVPNGWTADDNLNENVEFRVKNSTIDSAESLILKDLNNQEKGILYKNLETNFIAGSLSFGLAIIPPSFATTNNYHIHFDNQYSEHIITITLSTIRTTGPSGNTDYGKISVNGVSFVGFFFSPNARYPLMRVLIRENRVYLGSYSEYDNIGSVPYNGQPFSRISFESTESGNSGLIDLDFFNFYGCPDNFTEIIAPKVSNISISEYTNSNTSIIIEAEEQTYPINSSSIIINDVYTMNASECISIQSKVRSKLFNFEIPVDYLLYGENKIQIFINDTYNNINSSVLVYTNFDNILPELTILEPLDGNIYQIPPEFNIEIADENLYSYWCEINEITYSFSNGTMNSMLWDSLVEGKNEIKIFARDLGGNIAQESINITKDSLSPLVNIINPSNNSWFSSPFVFEVQFIDSNLYNTWSIVNNNGTILNFSGGLIDLSLWDSLNEGSNEFEFFADDLSGKITSNNIIIKKDTIDPIFNDMNFIGDIWWASAPNLQVEIYDLNLDTYWLEVNNNGTNLPFDNGTLDSGLWNSLNEGSNLFDIYAEDQAGNIEIYSISILKNTLSPMISLDESISDSYWSSPPTLEVVFNDQNIGSYWLEVNNNGTNLPINNGTLDSGLWNSLNEGSNLFEIFVVDHNSLIYCKSLTINKDTFDPSFSDLNFIGDIWWTSAPNLQVEIHDLNLYSYWLEINNNETNLSFDNGTLDSGLWNSLNEGSNLFEIYAEDLAGNIAIYSVIILKDSIYPEISLNETISNIYWSFPPILEVTFSDLNLDSYWLEVNNNRTYLAFNNGTLDQSLWNSLDEGPNEFLFFAQDLSGKITSNNLFINKDTTDPIINDLNFIGDFWWVSAPNLQVEIYDINFDIYWLEVNNNGTNLPIINGTLDSGLWNSLNEGSNLFEIYAKDLGGNIAKYSISILKDSSSPKISVNAPISDSYWSSPPYFEAIFSDPNLDSYWIEINSNSINLAFDNGTLELSLWNSLPEGINAFIIYANDSFGIEDFVVINIIKDTINPKIYLSENLDDSWHLYPFNMEIEILETNLKTSWIEINNDGTHHEFIINSFISDEIWALFQNGSNSVTIFVEDNTELNSTLIFLVNKGIPKPVVIKSELIPSINGNSFIINWDAQFEYDNFIIYRSNTPIDDFSIISSYSITEIEKYEDYMLLPGEYYYYIITCYDNMYSDPSESVYIFVQEQDTESNNSSGTSLTDELDTKGLSNSDLIIIGGSFIGIFGITLLFTKKKA